MPPITAFPAGEVGLGDGPAFSHGGLAQDSLGLPLPVGEDNSGLLGREVHEATDAALAIGNRAGRVGEVGLFHTPVALQLETHPLVEDRDATVHDGFDVHDDRGPHVRPDFSGGTSKCIRVTLTQDGTVGVVVDVDQVRPPTKPVWKRRR